MNKIAILSLSALGGSLLFSVSFLGFAKLNHVPLNTLPMVGGMFPALPEDSAHGESAPATGLGVGAHAVAPVPQATAENGSTHEPAASHADPQQIFAPVHEARAGIFEMLDVDGLYTQAELSALGESLRAKVREAEMRAAEIGRREELLADRLAALDERRRTMDEFAKQLDAREREVKAREAELGRDADASSPNGSAGTPTPASMAQFFVDGDVDVIAKRLVGFSPEEGARILARLEPGRAKELLEALPTASWRSFAEAYALAVPKKP
jgi:hypothetical protein